MLGRECISYIRGEASSYNTDDEIALAIGKYFPVLHSDAAVAIYHQHDSPTRMGNSAKRRFDGLCELVRGHKADIVREWGLRRLFRWRVRIVKSFVQYQVRATSTQIMASQSTNRRFLLRLYRRGLLCCEVSLRSFLRMHFDCDWL